MPRDHSGSRGATRRRTLTLTGALLAGLAGCTGDDGEGTTDDGASGDDATGDGMAGDEGGTDGEAGGELDIRGGVPTEPSDGAEVAMVTEEGAYYYEPEIAWVTPGSTVTFVNESGSHTATAYAEANDQPERIPEGAEAFDSGTLSESGAEFEHTFETEGVYDYYCVPHETLGMLGTVIVGEPEVEGQPGLESPQEEFADSVSQRLESLNEAAQEALEAGEVGEDGGAEGGDAGGGEEDSDAGGSEGGNETAGE